MIAKDEPQPPHPQHHGHLTALSIAPSTRGTGLARQYMDTLEQTSGLGYPLKEKKAFDWSKLEGGDEVPSLVDSAVETAKTGAGAHQPEANGAEKETEPQEKGVDGVDAFFVDLFVRCNNHRAVDMYEKLGYSVYRRVVE